uniref:Uncharacterized protein n=1 Tax=Ackermannviridae sp. TaxID=2831612 RepID=A0A8S5RTG3_9CAUD|nr:MAG TPA: hypothetical protein [Ackermannviridae sp.]
MDAVEFFKTMNRLCRNQGCEECPVFKEGLCMVMRIGSCGGDSDKSIEETVSKVEQYAKDHPVKTRQSEFLKMFPKAAKNGRVLDFCPKDLDIDYMPPKRCENISCSACKTGYWNEEVTDNE